MAHEDAVGFLREAKRLLKPGGTLRLSTPDLAIYAAAFFDPVEILGTSLIAKMPLNTRPPHLSSPPIRAEAQAHSPK